MPRRWRPPATWPGYRKRTATASSPSTAGRTNRCSPEATYRSSSSPKTWPTSTRGWWRVRARSKWKYPYRTRAYARSFCDSSRARDNSFSTADWAATRSRPWPRASTSRTSIGSPPKAGRKTNPSRSSTCDSRRRRSSNPRREASSNSSRPNTISRSCRGTSS